MILELVLLTVQSLLDASMHACQVTARIDLTGQLAQACASTEHSTAM